MWGASISQRGPPAPREGIYTAVASAIACAAEGAIWHGYPGGDARHENRREDDMLECKPCQFACACSQIQYPLATCVELGFFERVMDRI